MDKDRLSVSAFSAGFTFEKKISSLASNKKMNLSVRRK